jgi:two-component system sensor histidine kinase RegB
MLFHYVPFELLSPVHNHSEPDLLNPHLLGMWLNFVVSALLITYFVVRMAHAIRDQEQQLQHTREEISNNEHILGLATLAAGTAHELATPLSTMSVTLADLARERNHDDSLFAEISLLQQQLDVCKKTLRKLTQTAQLPLGNSRESQRADLYLTELIDQWKIMRPDAEHTLTIKPATPAPVILTDPTLTQAIQNLLNNAVDASGECINVSLDWDDTRLKLTIEDNGPGLPNALAGRIGKPFVTTKHQGLGLGLFLSHATAGRFNGRLEIYNRKGKGTCTELTLPLAT